MPNMIHHVESALRNYTAMKQELSVLEFELKRLTMPLDPDSIESMVFTHAGGEWVSGSFHSDKTADIVTRHVDGQRDAKYHALKNVICNMRMELRRLEHYLSLLPKDEADVIEWFYFEKLSWSEILEKATATQRTMQRRRQRGFDKLVSFYTMVDKLPNYADEARMRVRFISYVHEEQYLHCLEHVLTENRTPGLDAMLYIISGCNELWNAGADTFVDFASGEVISQESISNSFSEEGAKLLRLAYCFADGLKMNRGQLLHTLYTYFSGLDLVHLELAIEAMRLALFSSF